MTCLRLKLQLPTWSVGGPESTPMRFWALFPDPQDPADPGVADFTLSVTGPPGAQTAGQTRNTDVTVR